MNGSDYPILKPHLGNSPGFFLVFLFCSEVCSLCFRWAGCYSTVTRTSHTYSEQNSLMSGLTGARAELQVEVEVECLGGVRKLARYRFGSSAIVPIGERSHWVVQS